MTGAYRTAGGFGRGEHIDRRSRFLGHVQPVSTAAAALAFVEEVRRREPEANHHVWAYLLRGGELRWSDDGEPGGTAGRPTLAVLQGEGVTDVCCVTARYFGGTLLGSGGLVRAYSAAARLALSAAGVCEMTPWVRGCLTCAYGQYEKLRRLLTDRGARVEDAAFAEGVELTLTAPEGLAEGLTRLVRDATAGETALLLGETVFRPGEIS